MGTTGQRRGKLFEGPQQSVPVRLCAATHPPRPLSGSCTMLSSFLLACSRGFVEARPARLASVPALLRPFTSTKACLGMEEFFAVPLGEGKAPQRAGRSWLASELRLKSFEDLHKLWFVCLKERNFLLTERLYYRQMLQAAPEPERLHKVKKTMAGIKVVIGERARASQALEEDRERERKVAAVASALVGMEGASSRGSASSASASSASTSAAEAQPAAEAPTSAAAAPATPAAIKAERRSSVMDAEEEKARAALHRRKELLHVRAGCSAR
jgi:large subunit ribosomal protein L47